MDKFTEVRNPFPDIEDGKSDVISTSTGKLNTRFKKELLPKTEDFLISLDEELYNNAESADQTVYTGISGIILLYLFVACKRNSQSHLQSAINVVQKILRSLRGQSISFLTGNIGPLALATVLYSKQGNKEKAMEFGAVIKKFIPAVRNLTSDETDSILDGRAGYLYALLFVNKHTQMEVIDPGTVKLVISIILANGKNTANENKGEGVPLLYKWQNKLDFSILHGTAGILYMLLQAKSYLSKSDLDCLIKPTIDYIVRTRLASGHFPPTRAFTDEHFVQWCVGAPGMVHLLCLAYKVFNDMLYLKVAERCCDVIWENGLFRMENGLCHGTGGNVYAFLSLYQVTNELNDLHRACKFSQWCIDFKKNQSTLIRHIDSHPFSLYEGLAGIVYMSIDLLQPISAKFPGFAI